MKLVLVEICKEKSGEMLTNGLKRIIEIALIKSYNVQQW